jgi:hypothetical protein
MTMTEILYPAAPAGAMRARNAAADALRLAAARAAGRPLPGAMITHTQPTTRASRANVPARDRLPPLAPAETRAERRSFVGVELHANSIVDEETRFAHRAETKSEIARLTVYTMNATLMLMAFPVGFALLVFNILGGENLRTTAHAMALTGFGIALASMTGIGTGGFGLL